VSAPAVAKLIGRLVLVDVKQRRVRIRRQIDVEQGDDRLETLRVDHRPLLERKCRSVEDEREVRRSPESGTIIKLDRDRLALLGDVQEPRVAGQVDVVG